MRNRTFLSLGLTNHQRCTQSQGKSKKEVEIERPEIIESIENEEGYGIDFIDDGNI